MRVLPILAVCALVSVTRAAELRFDFGATAVGQSPTNFHSTAAGGGKPGEWRVTMDEVPPLLAPLSEKAPSVSRRAVLGQFARHPVDEHFPLLVFDGETFGDFTLTTRFKIVSGEVEQMAGIAFRLQNNENFYVVRASALGRNVRFYKVVNGIRSDPIGPAVPIRTGEWHTLKVDCKGNQIRISYDDREVIPPLSDPSFSSGKIAFWTKSDSVSYFADTIITYKPRIPLAQTLVKEAMEKYPRILALKVYVADKDRKATRIIASKAAADVGQSGGQYELACLEQGQTFYAKAREHLEMVVPLRDRNGDAVAAVRVHLNSFAGQTEQNALIRVKPIVNEMQLKLQATEEPLE
jgi:hypothetical protein